MKRFRAGAEAFQALLERGESLSGFAAFINEFACPETRKSLIMHAHHYSTITDAETDLLIELYGLEEA